MNAMDGHGRKAVKGATLAVVMLLGAPRAQDASQLQRSLDDLVYRMSQMEGELGKLRKNPPQPANPKMARSRADSLLPGLAARIDSLAARLSGLESGAPGSVPDRAAQGPQAKDSAPAADPASPARDSAALGELRALRGEIRALTGLLAAARAVSAPQGAATSLVPNPGMGGSALASAAPAGRAPEAAAAGPRTNAFSGAMAPAASGPGLPPGLVLTGDIQIQGERRLANGSGQNNLDDFWGRLNIGAEYQGPGFQSKANVRIFPEGFGFEPLTGATFDTSGQGSLKTQTQPSSRVVVNHAWARFSRGAYGLKVGRFETQESQSASYGNYIDQGPSGRFLARPAIHNAAEGAWTSGPWSSSLMLESGDRKLDRGSLRAWQTYAGPGGAKASLGYRSNLFDRLRFPEADILHRLDAGAVSPKLRGWQAFAEAAWIQTAKADDLTPVLAGLRPPVGKFLDMLSLEAEWLPDRKAAGKDKPVLFNAYARKTLGRARLETGLFSDPAKPAADAYSLGLRMTASLK